MNLKRTALWCMLFAAMGTMFYTSCDKTGESAQHSTPSTKGSKVLTYQTTKNAADGKEHLVEFKISNETVLEILIDGKSTDILKYYAFKVYPYPEDAIAAFEQRLEQGFECVSIERFDLSAYNNITGNEPTSEWVVVFGHAEEDGNCDWMRLSTNSDEL